MSDVSTAQPPPASPAQAVRVLAVLQATAGVVLALATDKNNFNLVAALFLGTLFAQAGLVGILLGLGTQGLPLRVFEFAVGLAYFGLPILLLGAEHEWRDSGLFASCAAVVAGVSGIGRRKGIRIRVPAAGELDSQGVAARFGIRHLLGCTLVVAAILRLGQLLQHSEFWGVLFAYGLSYAAIPCAATWIVLGQRNHCASRIAVFVVGAAAVGLVGMAYQMYQRPEPGLTECSAFAITALFGAIILLASLALLRHCGLRLMPVREREPDQT